MDIARKRSGAELNDGVALKRTAEDREVWRHVWLSKPAVQQKTINDDDDDDTSISVPMTSVPFNINMGLPKP